MARNKQKQDTEQVDIEELKSECLYLCSELLSELDQEVLPKRRENFTKNEELKLANQSTVMKSCCRTSFLENYFG